MAPCEYRRTLLFIIYLILINLNELKKDYVNGGSHYCWCEDKRVLRCFQKDKVGKYEVQKRIIINDITDFFYL